MSHGGPRGSQAWLGQCPAMQTRDRTIAMDELKGFCHWPAAPGPGQLNRLTDAANWPALAAQIAKLLQGPAEWPDSLAPPVVPGTSLPSGDTAPPGGSLQKEDNPSIPAGFTYLLQLLVHDLVSTQTPFWAVDPQIGTENLQLQPLQLVALYGNGPSACPLAYEPAGLENRDRFKFRLRPFVRPADPGASIPYPFLDIMRAEIPNVGDGTTVEPLVADPRNVDNLIVAQMTALFALLHNIVADQIDGNPQFKPGVPDSIRRAAIFAHARVAVTRIYRRIVLGQLLDKVLHPDIRDAYRAGAMPLCSETSMPLELSHGVLRFGHAMVRDSYILRPNPAPTTLKTLLTVANHPSNDEVQLKVAWQVAWSRFFQMESTISPNFSRRIGPGISPFLFKSDVFEPIDQNVQLGVPYRDLKSALLARLWSVDALVEEISTRNATLLPKNWRFRCAAARRAAISDWINDVGPSHGVTMTPNDLARVAADPPLPLFVLLEAALDPLIGGRHLGVLGSIILADIVFGIARRTPLTAHDVIAKALPVLQAEELDTIDTIEACIRYVGQPPLPAAAPSPSDALSNPTRP